MFCLKSQENGKNITIFARYNKSKTCTKLRQKDAKKTQKSCPKDVLFAPQDSIGKGSIDKDSIGEGR